MLMIDSEGGRRTGEEDIVVTARERRIVMKGSTDKGALGATLDGMEASNAGPGIAVVLRAAPAWRDVLDECRNRDADGGVDAGVEVEVDALRLNCGCRRGRYFRRDVSILEAGANAPPRIECAGIIAIDFSRVDVVRSGRSEAISGWLQRAGKNRKAGYLISKAEA